MSKQVGRYSGRSQSSPREQKSQSREQKPLSREHQLLLDWHKHVRFKKAIFGGVKESDVWKKLGELNELYNQALAAERIRYDALLAQQEKAGEADHE